MSETIHATCVAIRGRGVLLLGASGAGKSDLALRLIDRGAELVSDDGTVVAAHGGRLHASCGPNIAGRLEARGIGILEVPARFEVPLALACALDQTPERLPAVPLPVRRFDGVELPLLALHPFEASAPVKVEQALLIYGVPA